MSEPQDDHAEEEDHDLEEEVENPSLEIAKDDDEEEEDDLDGYISEETTTLNKDDQEDLEELQNELNAINQAMISNESLIAKDGNRVVMVQNLPIVNQEKYEKLHSKLLEMFSQIGNLQIDASGKPSLYLPMKPGNSNESVGAAFVCFEKPESALLAVEKVNGFAFGKQKISVTPYSDLEKYGKWSETFQAPSNSKTEYKASESLRGYLVDELGRDQFVIRFQKSTEVYWAEGISMNAQTTLATSGPAQSIWTEMFVAWSPKGTYFATFHLQGIVIWGGNGFQKLRRFAHHGVQYAEFSPCERFLMTWDGKEHTKAFLVWDVTSGALLRDIKVEKGSEWPIMKWNYNGEFFARATENGISIFETKTMKLLNGKPIVAKGIVSFEWSPTDKYIAFWSPEEENNPAKVLIIDPTQNGKELRSKNLVNVSSVKLHWQSNGDYLCAQVLRHTKSKKTTFTNFELFRMRENGFPNEFVNVNEAVLHFSFEPNGGKRFGVVAGDEQRAIVTFYEISQKEITQVVQLVNKPVSGLYWSPIGNNLIMANLTNINGVLEFYDLDQKMSLSTETHFMCNDIQWDPSGRLVATCVTQPMFQAVSMRYTMENGYKLWSFQGQKLAENPQKQFYQFIWRPRPKPQLTEEEKNSVIKSLAKYIKKYETEDSIKLKRAQMLKDKEKILTLAQFRKDMEERRKQFLLEEEKRKQMNLPPAIPTEEDSASYEEVEVITEELISEKTETF